MKEFAQSGLFYHPHADAWLVQGRAKGIHIIGWVARQRPETVAHVRRFLDEASAAKAFSATIRTDDVPEALVMAQDWQQSRVYRWEDKHVLKFGRILDSPGKARSLMRRIAQDYGIECPKLCWTEHNGHSEYDADDNFINFGDRNSMTLLHEMAHAIHAQRLGEQMGPHHSPGFVEVAIELYHRYGGIDTPVLTETAGKAGILGDVYQPSALPKPARRRVGYICR